MQLLLRIPWFVMELQYQAATDFARELSARQMSVAIAHGSDGYLVSVREHPSVTVHFGFDHLRGLRVRLAFDGQQPTYVNYLPTETGAAEFAELVIAKIEGVGGRPSRSEP